MMKKSSLVVIVLPLLLPLAIAWPKHKDKASETAPATTTESTATPAATAAPTPAAPVMGPEKLKPLMGLPVHLELQEELYGKHSQEGQEVHYLVAEDVTGPDKEVVIKKGAPATGHVLNAQGTGGRLSLSRKGGKLDFNAEYAMAADGTRVPLIFNTKRKGTGGAGIAILFGPGRGKDARAHKGHVYDAVVGTAPPTETEPDDSKGDAKK